MGRADLRATKHSDPKGHALIKQNPKHDFLILLENSSNLSVPSDKYRPKHDFLFFLEYKPKYKKNPSVYNCVQRDFLYPGSLQAYLF